MTIFWISCALFNIGIAAWHPINKRHDDVVVALGVVIVAVSGPIFLFTYLGRLLVHRLDKAEEPKKEAA